jgi:glucose-6-phosphate isomerase
MLKLDTLFLKSFISDHEITTIEPSLKEVHTRLTNRTCPGNDYLGWLDLPFTTEFNRIEEVAQEVRSNAEQFVMIGIGGSYLGARATIEFLSPYFQRSKPEILYFGHHLSPDYAHELINSVDPSKLYINVISKSGTTTEPGVAFRLLEAQMASKLSDKEMGNRIIATTDKSSGALVHNAKQKGYRRFVIPDDIGGRFSVLTPVGLLPIAVAGLDIRELVAGARDMAQYLNENTSLDKNPAWLYAAIRFILYQKGKRVEILSSFDPAFHYVAEWWKQLFGESEGKDGKGLYPSSADFTTDLHSLGQYIQDGYRHLFETFVMIDKPQHRVEIPENEENLDKLNYLADKDLAKANYQAFRGTALAHYDGGIPNLTITLPQKSEYYLGQLFYFFEMSVALSGLLLGVNPFDQPGVESYKQNMFALLGHPDYTDRTNELQKRFKTI